MRDCHSVRADGLTRRDFIKSTAAIGGAALGGVWSEAAVAEERPEAKASEGHGPLIDTNVYLARWPGRRVPLDETKLLVDALRRKGVTQAWAGSFDALLHKDLGSANSRLAEECRRHGRGVLVPFGCVNPELPDWKEELRRCREDYRMPGIRVHPNYHGYKLDSVEFATLLGLACENEMVVQIAMMMEDERMQNPLMKAPHVDVSALPNLLKDHSSARVVLLNWWRALKGDQVTKLANAGQVYFDIATLEQVGGIERLLKLLPGDRIVFGSYAPLFYFESAYFKLKESPLTDPQLTAVRSGNARKLLGA